MDKNLIKKIKERLWREKGSIKEQLQNFAKEDNNLKGDWDTTFPFSARSESGGAALERAADEVEEYEARLPVEHNLETKLKDIDSALDKIEKGTYGLCEKCGKPIAAERLDIYPEARFCISCNSK